MLECWPTKTLFFFFFHGLKSPPPQICIVAQPSNSPLASFKAQPEYAEGSSKYVFLFCSVNPLSALLCAA